MAQGLKLETALKITGISKHQYYYRPTSNKKRGRPATTTTLKGNQQISNEQVVRDIKHIQSQPDTNYGYQKMTYALMILGYIINHKKVYRLMKQAFLLKIRRFRTRYKNYAQYRTVKPQRPLEVLEMDIKMVWLNQCRRHVYILTIIDTFNRVVLDWSVGYHMKQAQVNQAIKRVIVHYLQPADLLNKELHVELRNDNGPQFSASKLRAFIAENHIKHVFTHPYTPQENGHIESFHSILKEALGKQPFWSYDELETRLKQFYTNYNEHRIHSSTASLPPKLFWKCWELGLIERIEMSNKRQKFKLKIPYQQLSGNVNLREFPCLNYEALDGVNNLKINKVVRPNSLILQPSV